MKRTSWMSVLSVLSVLLAAPAFAVDDDAKDENERIANAAMVLQEVLNVPEDVPQDILDRAECVLVFPSVIKGAFIVGGQYGRGVMTCRGGDKFTGPWTAPAMYALEGASVGFQVGGEAADLVLMVMNDQGVDSLLKSKVKLGADASMAAGPKGRKIDAATDVFFKTEILAYSRSRGVFAGVSLEGSTLRPDDDANRRLYERDITAQQIVREHTVTAPASAHLLLQTLQRVSPNDLSDDPPQQK